MVSLALHTGSALCLMRKVSLVMAHNVLSRLDEVYRARYTLSIGCCAKPRLLCVIRCSAVSKHSKS